MRSIWKLENSAFKLLIHRLLFPEQSQRDREKEINVTRVSQWRHGEKVKEQEKRVLTDT